MFPFSDGKCRWCKPKSDKEEAPSVNRTTPSEKASDRSNMVFRPNRRMQAGNQNQHHKCRNNPLKRRYAFISVEEVVDYEEAVDIDQEQGQQEEQRWKKRINKRRHKNNPQKKTNATTRLSNSTTLWPRWPTRN